MTIDQITLYTCDRCGATHEIKNSTAQPEGWMGLTYTHPPKAVFEGDRMILCVKCRTEFMMFLKPGVKAIFCSKDHHHDPTDWNCDFWGQKKPLTGNDTDDYNKRMGTIG